MAVLLPNVYLAVRKRGGFTEDAHGDAYGGPSYDEASAPLPGRVSGGGGDMQGGEEVFNVALDPSLWPLAPRDLVVEYAGNPDLDEPVGAATGREWLLRSADVIRHTEDPSVNYVRCQGHLRAGASTMP